MRNFHWPLYFARGSVTYIAVLNSVIIRTPSFPRFSSNLLIKHYIFDKLALISYSDDKTAVGHFSKGSENQKEFNLSLLFSKSFYYF